jgi:ATP-dependent Lon protease
MTKNEKLFYLKNKIIFPHCTMPVTITLSNHSRGLSNGDMVLAYPIRTLLDLVFYHGRIATLAEIIEIKIKGDKATLTLRGIARARLKKLRRLTSADYESIDDKGPGCHPRLIEEIRKKSQELVFLINIDESDKLIRLFNFITDPHQITDFVASYFISDIKKKFKMFREIRVAQRGEFLLLTLNRLINSIKNKRQAK